MGQAFTSNSYARGPEVTDLSGMTQQVTDLSDLIGTVQTSANGKNSSFHLASVVNGQPNQPPNTTDNPRVVGDLWFQTDKQNAVYKWDAGGGGQWLPATLGDGAIGNLNVGHLTTGTLNATVTLSGTIATATGNVPRVQIDSNGIKAYKDTGSVPYFQLDKTQLTINGGVIRSAFPTKVAVVNGVSTTVTNAHWAIASFGTVWMDGENTSNVIQDSNEIQGFTTLSQFPAKILVTSFNGEDSKGGDRALMQITAPQITITNDLAPSIVMETQSRDKSAQKNSIKFSAAGTGGFFNFDNRIDADYGLTSSSGNWVLGDQSNTFQRLISINKMGTGSGSQIYKFESRQYLSTGIIASHATVLFQDGVAKNRLDLFPDVLQTDGRLWVKSNADVDMFTANKPAFMIGDPASNHLRMDANEMQSMKNDIEDTGFTINDGFHVEGYSGRFTGPNVGGSWNFAMLAGNVSVTAPVGGGVVKKVIDFADFGDPNYTRFRTTPFISVSFNSTVPGQDGPNVSYSNVTQNGFEIYFFRGSNTSTSINWIALGL